MPAGGDWTLDVIPARLQADGHSCGDWAHYFRCRVLAYVANGLGSCSFPSFLVSSEMRNLQGLSGTALADAEKHQRLVATQRRDALRKLLRAAARSGPRIAIPHLINEHDQRTSALSAAHHLSSYTPP